MDDRYRLVRRLGAGGMSVVWQAHDEVLARDVALKVLAPGSAADPAVLERIRFEARTAAGLHHPNIVGVYDYGETADGAGPVRPYVVMELVEGRTLDDLLTEQALPWRTAVDICAQVAGALAAVHGRGVVHRDVKPGNVMVTPEGVKLVDFGISAAAGAVDETDGEVLGTPAYLAPERLDGGPVRVATDVYALGLLLYRALAGRLPWTASTVTEMVGNHLYTEPAPLPPRAGLPPEVAELCRRCLAKRPEDRPTAAEAALILSAAAEPPAKILRFPVRPQRRSLLVAAAIVLLAMVASLVWWPSATKQPAQAETPAVPSASAPAIPRPKTSQTPTVTAVASRTKVKKAAAPGPAAPGQAADPAQGGPAEKDKKAKKAKAEPAPPAAPKAKAKAR